MRMQPWNPVWIKHRGPLHELAAHLPLAASEARRSGKETPRSTCRHRVESLVDSVALLTVGATRHG
jgi:hypothetical protein